MIGIGFNMQAGLGSGILDKAMGMSGGMSIMAGMNIGGMGMSMGLGFGMDSSSFSPDAMMGGGSNFFHPLMSGGFGSPQCGSMNGMGMIPGMMNPGMMGMGGGQQMQMMQMMMQLMQMMMQMMQQNGMGGGMMGGMPGMMGNNMMGGGMPGFGMPGGFGSPMGMSMPGMGGGYGMPGMGGGYGMPGGGYGSPVGMNNGVGSAPQAQPGTQIPSYGPNANKAQVGQMLDAAARKYGIPPNILKAVAWQESTWRPNARSFDGGHGKGVMQIDDRFHAFARTNDVFDPAKNIDYGAKYLSDLYKKTGDWNAALKRYNGGSSYPPKIMSLAQKQPWAS